MNKNITIWHNKSCSTSRKALDLIHSKTEGVVIREYIKNPPSEKEILAVLKMMGEKPAYILRKKDKVFQEWFEGKELSDKQWIKAMAEHPSIIERPIVIMDQKAYLARPFEDFVEKFNIITKL